MTEENENQAENVAVNEATMKKLAEIVPEEALKLFDADLRDGIARAKKQVDRSKVDLGFNRDKQAPSDDGSMDMDQMGEWLRCKCAAARGEQFEVDEHLDADGRVTQALTPSVGSAGGNLIPDDFRTEIEKRADEPAVFWQLVTKRNTNRSSVTKNEVTSYPTVNQGSDAKSNSATTSDEIAATEPEWSLLTWTMRDVDARYPAKLDLLRESPIDVMDELMDIAADMFSVYREDMVPNGAGSASSLPEGILQGGNIDEVDVDPDDDGLSVDDIMQFASNLPKRYRARAHMIMGSQTMYSVAANLAENVREAQFLVNLLPPMNDSGNVIEGKIILGDFRRYVVYRSQNMSILTSIAAERKTQEIVITERWDGFVTLEDAFRIGIDTSYS